MTDLYLLAAERLGWTAADTDRFPAGALYLALGTDPPKEKHVADLPPIVQEFRADLSHIVATARTFAKHFTAFADDLTADAGEPDDGLTRYEVRLRGTDGGQPPRTEHVRAIKHVAEDGWVRFYVAGGRCPARYAEAAVESVKAP